MSTVKLTNDEWHKKQAVDLFNAAWDLMDKQDRTPQDDLEMIHTAHTSRYHWSKVGKPLHLLRGEWQISRVYSLVGKGDSALYHGQTSLDMCIQHQIADFDLAFGYEAVARAYSVLGDEQNKTTYIEKALAAAENIDDKENKDYAVSEIKSV